MTSIKETLERMETASTAVINLDNGGAAVKFRYDGEYVAFLITGDGSDMKREMERATWENKRRYILIERRTETSLDEEGMVHAAMRLNHAQVVNPSVAVEIEVVDHIPTGVEQLLELRYRPRLSESRSYRIEVEVEREVGIVIGDCHRSDGRGLRRRRCDGRGIDGLRRHYRLYGRRYREDRRPATRHHQRGQY